jgi:membrane-associated phospholipid phosphatase
MILVCGLVGYIRLKTNSHKPSEVYAGFLVGAVVMFLLFFFV